MGIVVVELVEAAVGWASAMVTEVQVGEEAADVLAVVEEAATRVARWEGTVEAEERVEI